MSADEALGLIIEDYCEANGIGISEFSRKANVSRAYINKIISNKLGKYGVSTTIKEQIAKGLDITDTQLSSLIKEYKKNKTKKNLLLQKKEFNEDELIIKINNQLKNLNNEQLEKIHEILANSNDEKLELLIKTLENMK